MSSQNAGKAFKPTPEQLAASNPERSVWVSANAGSGKTHVLVERVIRLLLAGAKPDSILCITYTKAAAAEMSGRLFARLGGWTGLDDDGLAKALRDMNEKDVGREALVRARRLFTAALETPGGLKIQTIHAFCERLLHLFPVEAGLAPGFRVMDERAARDLQQRATAAILRAAEAEQDARLGPAFAALSRRLNSEQFEALISGLVASLQELGPDATHLGPEGYELLLKSALGLARDATVQSLTGELLAVDAAAYAHHAGLMRAYPSFSGVDVAAVLARIGAGQCSEADFLNFFLTTKFEPRKSLISSAAKGTHPATAEFLTEEQERVSGLLRQRNTLEVIAASGNAFVLAAAILIRIEEEKRRLGLYDFADLISRTAQLLSSRAATQWVLYKLDPGLSHILVDEAQDTSPGQWQIVNALAEEFFAGEGRERPGPRTLFVVGDQKQSIYSFQGADALAFINMRAVLTGPARGASALQAVDLAVSYRSADIVLKDVDKVFPPADLSLIGVPSGTERGHTAIRKGAAIVELWPLTEVDDDELPQEPWTKPVDRPPQASPRRRLAEKIAKTIAGWIAPQSPRQLASEARAVRADDILLLFQTRGPLYHMVLAALRKEGVAVAGADRLALLESLIVKDLLALLGWLVLPQDDHALAVILKSPLVPRPISENDLFALAHDHPAGRMQARLQGENATYLKDLQQRARRQTPFALLSHVLAQSRRAIAARLGDEALEASAAMLDLALEHEREHGASLFGFLRWFSGTETVLRREMERGSGAVRLMTVHGAKGLESKIVFLPDASDMPGAAGARPTLLSVPPGNEGAGLPLWLPGGTTAITGTLEEWKNQEATLARQERNRLLYVAMTRAEDELYITGTKPKKRRLPEHCWWNTITAALGEPQGDQPLRSGPPDVRAPVTAANIAPAAAPPAWLKADPPSETMAKPATPTGLAHAGGGFDAGAARHGRAVHKLLEELADAPADARAALAERRGPRLGIAPAEALALAEALNSPDLAPFFGPLSQGEVDIAGLLPDGRELYGRLDRLAVTAEGLWLLDYKTDRSARESLLPSDRYAVQMASYAALLRQAHPGRPVTAALFWTGPKRLEILPESLLTAALQESEPAAS
ncbi:MAG: double-strand break repair helicase AddA [Alphaproteobacteria bacterium]|nr:double-strand break repair helicase AddA [Alphaproteobacteria bacterium]